MINKIIKKIKNLITESKGSKERLSKAKAKFQKKYSELQGDTEITILSPNCIAGEIYNLLGLKFLSPTINCSFEKQKFFVNFCCYLDEYIKTKPKIIGKKDGHPRMMLESKKHGNIIINWPHDTDESTVLNNWERRKIRINKEKLYIIASTNYLTEEDIDKLNMVKTSNTVIFTAQESNKKNVLYVKKYSRHKKVGKYNVKKLNGLYEFLDFFDFIEFLTSGLKEEKND